MVDREGGGRRIIIIIGVAIEANGADNDVDNDVDNGSDSGVDK